MTLGRAMSISATGLHAERFRMDVISANIANANSMTANGREAYRRQVVFLEQTDNGVQIQRVTPDNSPLKSIYEPGNPAADAQGFVEYSNVEPVKEMVDMMSATRAYEANIAAFNSARGMSRAALTIGQR
ncbi:MAG: flagellar basal body rod protein FlgC [Fimbriimonadaceae bacterium]|nr:flagellar basal body rod protein FlgC [Fimbriimonadaceae bacterium]